VARPLLRPSRRFRDAGPFLLTGAWVIAVAMYPFQFANPTLTAEYVGGALLLYLVAFVIPWSRRSAKLAFIPPALACAACGVLMAGQQSVDVVLTALLVLPILWSALHGRGWQTGVVTTVALGTVLAVGASYTGITTHGVSQVLIVWTTMLCFIAFTVHVLRGNLETTIKAREDMIRQGTVVDLAAAELYATLNPDEVTRIGVQAAAHLILPRDTASKEALFFLVEGERSIVLSHYDEHAQHQPVDEVTCETAEMPMLAAALAESRPVLFSSSALEVVSPGPIRDLLEGVTGGIAVGVHVPDFEGVMIIPRRDGLRFTEEHKSQLQRFIMIFDLALSRALQHAAEATTDPLTGHTNRREFMRRLQTVPRGDRYVVLSMDVDSLRAVAEEGGRSARDDLLVEIGKALTRCVRRSDLVARVADGEFCAMLPHQTIDTATIVAERIVKAVPSVSALGKPASISVGVAGVDGTDDGPAALQAANRAMQRARSAGGGRYILDRTPRVQPAPELMRAAG